MINLKTKLINNVEPSVKQDDLQISDSEVSDVRF